MSRQAICAHANVRADIALLHSADYVLHTIEAIRYEV